MLAFSVAALGMVGIPPVAGFISKFYLCLGAWAVPSPYGMMFLAVILISSLLDVIYFFPIIYTAFFKKPGGELSGSGEVKVKEAPLLMVAPLAITAIISVVFFVYPNMFYIFDLVKMAIGDLFGGM
jgi:formate hydrogenlyase subunit 3/multisubunit Na+/H+ antiporter MnhD subunit